MKRYTALPFLFTALFAVGCAPQQVIVVTATPPPVVIVVTATPESQATSTTQPQVIVVTATPVAVATARATDVPTSTLRPTQVVLPTQGSFTPTAESYTADYGCGQFNTEWDDPIYGCTKVRNGNFTEGLVVSNGMAIPARWTLWNKPGASIPMDCGVAGCKFTISGTLPQASSGLTQTLRDVEDGQCYLIKAIYGFRFRTSPELVTAANGGWPDGIVSAIARINDRPLDGRMFSREGLRPAAGDGNFFIGVREYVYPVRGGSNPTPTVTIGIQTQWGSAQTGSTVSILGAYVFAAPSPYCDGIAQSF